jgi:putative flippase GtrA
MSLFLKIKNLIQHQKISKQLLKFLIIGAVSTLISYSTFLTALHLFAWHYLLANMAGFITSIGFSYYCNRRWTFEVGNIPKPIEGLDFNKNQQFTADAPIHLAGANNSKLTKFVDKSNLNEHKQSFTNYFLFYFCSLGVATTSLKILVDFFGIIPEIATIINIAGMTGVNFLGLKFLVFKK